MSDYQIGDLVRCNDKIGVISKFADWAAPENPVAEINQMPDSDRLISCSFDDLHKIAPLTIEDLRSHDFSQGNLQRWRASLEGVTELSIRYWKLEQSGGVYEYENSSEGRLEFSPLSNAAQRLTLREQMATHVFSPNLDGLRQLYLSKDDAIVAFAWMIREQQAEHRRSIAKLEQQEREMLAGVNL